MKQYTDITLLLDRSGSMVDIKESMEGTLRSFIKEHKKTPSTRLTVIQFDDRDDQEVTVKDQPIKNVEAVTIEPRGNTPLLDAFCKAIDGAGMRFNMMKETQRPDQVLFVVITDGQENASRFYSRKDVHARVTRQRNDYKWEFVYLGANQDVFAEARSLGLSVGTALQYTSSPMFAGENSVMSNYLTSSTAAFASRASGSVCTVSDEARVKSVDTTISTT